MSTGKEQSMSSWYSTVWEVLVVEKLAPMNPIKEHWPLTRIALARGPQWWKIHPWWTGIIATQNIHIPHSNIVRRELTCKMSWCWLGENMAKMSMSWSTTGQCYGFYEASASITLNLTSRKERKALQTLLASCGGLPMFSTAILCMWTCNSHRKWWDRYKGMERIYKIRLSCVVFRRPWVTTGGLVKFSIERYGVWGDKVRGKSIFSTSKFFVLDLCSDIVHYFKRRGENSLWLPEPSWESAFFIWPSSPQSLVIFHVLPLWEGALCLALEGGSQEVAEECMSGAGHQNAHSLCRATSPSHLRHA